MSLFNTSPKQTGNRYTKHMSTYKIQTPLKPMDSSCKGCMQNFKQICDKKNNCSYWTSPEHKYALLFFNRSPRKLY